MNNSEWLKSLEPAELKAWFESEHDFAAGELQRENMALARDLGECMAERDAYREKFGRAVDSAWEIVQLMDDESCGAAGSERNSCKVYVLNDGSCQCGNCGAIIAGVVVEGESEDGDWA